MYHRDVKGLLRDVDDGEKSVLLLSGEVAGEDLYQVGAFVQEHRGCEGAVGVHVYQGAVDAHRRIGRRETGDGYLRGADHGIVQG